MAASSIPEKLALKIVVDKVNSKVVFAEADNDFVDVLLSFLTLPLGTIVKLVGRPSNFQPVVIGCLSTLYESVVNLEAKHLCTETCKTMLLNPRNASEDLCQRLKVNIDDTEPTKLFICEDWGCSRKTRDSLVGSFRNMYCHCGKQMNREIGPRNSNVDAKVNDDGVFATRTARFVVSDNLNVMPNLLGTSIGWLNDLGIKDMNALEERTLYVGSKEILDLLKWSLLSKTPFTNLYLQKNQFPEALIFEHSQPEIFEGKAPSIREMTLKVLLRKSNKKVMFAQAEEDFVDFLFSLLTIPLGAVVHNLDGCSSLGSMDNLYKSVADLMVGKYLGSQDLKNKLVNPVLAPQFNCKNQLLTVQEKSLPKYSCQTIYDSSKYSGYLVPECSYQNNYGTIYAPLTFINPKTTIRETAGLGGFARGSSMFMVTDDLVVMPVSSISGISYLSRLNVPLDDLEERTVNIGMKEALSILKTSLISVSVLTNGLNLGLTEPGGKIERV